MITKYINDIKTKTSGMSKLQKLEYIITYYWYHILIIAIVFLLSIMLLKNIFIPKTETEFTCVLVNQQIDFERDELLKKGFAEYSKLDLDSIVINSDYNFSYGYVQLEGVNESSYEKFFLKWGNNELDCIIMPESLYKYSKEMGGTYLNLNEFDTGDLPLYKDGTSYTAVLVNETAIGEYMVSIQDEPLLLVFPSNSTHLDKCEQFLSYLQSL